jgi:hypothetical protein
MTPWEESWGYATRTQTGNCAELHLGDGQQICVQIGIDDEADAYAQLAACAPEMARLLLDLEWAHQDPSWGPACPACDALERAGHGRDCRLERVLRKAGVRP